MKIRNKINCITRIATLAIFFQLTISCGNLKSIKGSGNVVSTDRHLTGLPESAGLEAVCPRVFEPGLKGIILAQCKVKLNGPIRQLSLEEI